MARKFALLLLLLLLGLVLWLWRDTHARAPVAPPSAEQRPVCDLPLATHTEDGPVLPRESLQAPEPALTSAPTLLVVVCRARSDRHPLAGILVRATNAAELVTDGAGRAVLDVQPDLALTVSADDVEHYVSFEAAEVPALAAGETRELVFEHDAGEHAHLCGIVVAREDGRPLAAAEVRVDQKLRTRTDSEGRFEIDYAAHLPPAVRVDRAGFGPTVVGAAAGHETATSARRIELERAASLVVALQVPEGQAAARARLRAQGYEIHQDQAFTTFFYTATPALNWEADADAQWICTFEELPPGVSLEAEVLGSTGMLFHAAEPIVLAPGEKRSLAWDLRGSELVGHVFEADGKAAAGITLWLLRAQSGYRPYVAPHQAKDLVGRATSEADGGFRFASISPGTWLLAPKPDERELGAAPPAAIAPVPLEITIRAGEPRSSVDVRLTRGLYIRGTLVAPDGSTGLQGYVYAQAGGGVSTNASTDSHGRFTLGPLAPGSFSLEGSPCNTYLTSLPVAIEAGASEVLLRARPGAEVAGTVFDGESGAGVLAAIAIGNEGGSVTLTRTQPDGGFRLDGLEPGRYTLCASTTAGQAGELAGVLLDPGAPVTGLALVLKPGAKLRIRYEGKGIGQVSVRRNGAAIGGDGLEGGHSTLLVVPAGRVAVEFRYPDSETRETQELELAAGEEREVVFRTPAGK